MARGKLGILLMALLLAVSCPKSGGQIPSPHLEDPGDGLFFFLGGAFCISKNFLFFFFWGGGG